MMGFKKLMIICYFVEATYRFTIDRNSLTKNSWLAYCDSLSNDS